MSILFRILFISVLGFAYGEHCADILSQTECEASDHCEWHADDMACEDAGHDHDEDCHSGDVNSDGDLNIFDIITVVDLILADMASGTPCADINEDGNINILDVISMVDVIIAGREFTDATTSSLSISNGVASLISNGYIGAVQMRLSHGVDFSIEITDRSLISNYKTSENSTLLIVVAPESSELFKASGEFTVESVAVTNSTDYIGVEMPSTLSLSAAYPNPFNPSTSFSLEVGNGGDISVAIYNVGGQLVDIIFDGEIGPGVHSMTWNATSVPSGIYILRAINDRQVSTQKITLLK